MPLKIIHIVGFTASVVLLGATTIAGVASEQAPRPQQASTKPDSILEPADYIIGPEDVLTITVYGQDPMLSGDVVVRSDGKISRRLIGEMQAATLTPVELTAALIKAYAKFFEDPEILVQAKQINSRKVYISGNVFKPGAYSINDSMDIMQLIALAGGLQEYSDKENIRLLRRLPSGKTEAIPFNHNKIFESKNPDIPVLRPGDQVVVR
jgi:polysaccharide export outer membrane protein